MTRFRFWWQISRPRFWIYTLGPALIGLAAAGLFTPWWHDYRNILTLLYFTLPANLLIYGVNDIFDYDTDKHNPKKQQYEQLVTPERRHGLIALILTLNIPFYFFFSTANAAVQWSIISFWFFGIFYSCPPIRGKTKPFLDMVFNILYLFPGFVTYFAFGGTNFSWPVFIAGGLWCMAMHVYSAVPDISADRAAKLHTTATVLGRHPTLWLCLGLYTAAAIIVWPYFHWLVLPLYLPYLALMLWSMLGPDANVFRVYKYFPKLNTLIGFVIFWLIVWLHK